MISRLVIAVVGLFAGGWMFFDGIHVSLYGKYFGPEKPGPWSILFNQVGVNPFSLGPVFILFGILWLVFLVAVLRGRRWGWLGAMTVAIGSLWYLPVGTVLSIIYVLMLVLKRNQLIAMP